MKTSHILTLLSSLLLTLAFTPAIRAQTVPARPDRGLMPGASYAVSDFENISLTNGNLNATIPLASLPPLAGGRLKFTLSASYNSKLWNVTREQQQLTPFGGCNSWVVNTPQLSERGGWQIFGGYSLIWRNATEDYKYVRPDPPPTESCEPVTSEQLLLQSNWYRLMLVTPDGAEHELRPVDFTSYPGYREHLQNYYKETPDTQNTPLRYYSLDGSFLWAVVNPSSYATRWTIYLKDGTRVTQDSNGIQRIIDTNGNSIKMFSDAAGTHYQDEQTGREIRYSYDPAGNGGQGQGRVWYQTVGGTWMTVDVNFGTTQVQGKLYQVNDWDFITSSPCFRDVSLSTTISVIREIVFPVTEPGVPARRFTFAYNSDTTTSANDQVTWSCGAAPQSYTRTVSVGMGALSQIVAPTGATANYTYSRNGTHRYVDADAIPGETVTEKRLVHDGTTDIYTYQIDELDGTGGTMTAPDGSVTTETAYTTNPVFGLFFGHVASKSGLVYRSQRSGRERLERHWTTLVFSGANSGAGGATGTVTFNPVVDAEYFSLLDGSGNPIKMSAKTYQYDFNGNLLQETAYDWFDPNLVTRDAQGVPTGVPASATVLRVTNHGFYNPATTSSSANVYAKRALATATPLILDALQQTTLGPSLTQLSYDGQAYGVAPTVGNLTTQKVWADLDNKWIASSQTYGTYGNLATKTDARGKVTQFFYDDATHALPTRIVVDPQNGTGTQTTTTAYDYSTGVVTSQTDPNGAVSTISYTNQLLGTVDPFGRPGITYGPLIAGLNQRQRVTTTYKDSLRQVIVASDFNTENDKLLKIRTTTDMLGRVVLSEQTEDGTNYTISQQHVYEQLGKITFSSNPARSSAASTDGWTRTIKDTLGRVVEVATFGGTPQPGSGPASSYPRWTGSVTTSYDANFTTVADQTGKVRRSMVDGIGRLVRVDEPDNNNNLGSTASPVQPTSYAYSMLGNLTTVTQGSQTRTFVYDSLSRLRSATNPESGTTSYVYDDNGNLTQKTDARGAGFRINYVYDALNRNTTVDYANTAINPDLTRSYDSATNGKGRLWQSYAGGHETAGATVEHTKIVSYDAAGRPLDQRQRFKSNSVWSSEYQTQRAYNLAGAVTSQTYPAGRTVSYAYDNAGRVNGFSGYLGDGVQRTYATGIIYSPSGGLKKEQFGTDTPLYHKLWYTSRGQLAEIRVSTSYAGPTDTSWNRGAIINHYSTQCWGMCDGYAMPDNNGNVYKQEHEVPLDDQISSHVVYLTWHDYDKLNRLTAVHGNRYNSVTTQFTNPWKQTFIYDRYGNRRIDPNGANTYGGVNNKDFTVNTANNRLGVPGGQSGVMSYDNAGNLTTDTYTGAGSRTYDAENRMTQAVGGLGGTQYYTYNADGQRTRRKVDEVETWQIYGFEGELLAEYAANAAVASSQKEYGYRNGQLLVTAEPTTSPLDSLWVEDGIPTGGVPAGDGESWNWIGSNPAPSSGSLSHQSNVVSGMHQHYFYNATSTLTVNAGDKLFAYVYLDPANLPSEVMLQWNDGTWEHRAYWGANNLGWGINGTNSRRYMGALPAAGSWVRLEVPANLVGLEGRILSGMAFSLYGGRATWDRAGKTSANIKWLVADHLGTPRMVFDKTGLLVNTKRHDYLAFGEEWFAGMGGRTTGEGYVADGVRQKFTQKERDNETGLDYFLARYYSSTQGRFTSPDYCEGNPAHLLNSFERSSALPYATLLNPQTLNLYEYAYNNPLSYVDPDGHQGGRPQPLPGNKRYTIRPDFKNPNDAPNVHVFDKSGRRQVGRVAVKGTPDAPVYEWSGKVPERVKADVEAFIRQKGVQPRPPLHPRGPVSGTGPRGGGFRANGIAALAWLSLLLDAYNQYSHAQQFGYYFNYLGQMVVADLARTAQNLPQGQLVEFEGTMFKLKGDAFVSIDPDCEGCKLKQEKDGRVYIEGCKRCAEE